MRDKQQILTNREPRRVYYSRDPSNMSQGGPQASERQPGVD